MADLPNLHVLLADDDENDVYLMSRALKRLRWVAGFAVVPDGQSAVACLLGEEPYADRARFPFPNVLLLDHLMPALSGLDVLGLVRSEPRFARLPVVLLSGGLRPTEEAAVSRLGAVYCAKAAGFAETARILEQAIIRSITAARESWLGEANVLAREVTLARALG